jgi:predicted phage terminase large subunit-like protein
MMLSPAEYEFVLRRDFMGFIERAFYELNPQTRFSSGLHIEAIAARLEACRQGKIKRLIINLPPRNLKSHCASIAFPAWFLGHDPSKHVICASYGQDLADKLARDCRTVMNSSWYKRLFRTRLSDRQAVHDFMTTAQGSRLATSVGGVLTGRGADLILIDDPLKPDEALSETKRNAVNEWYDNTLMSRLNDKAEGCIIIIMQRLHQDDLVGHVLEQGHWEVLSLPAIAEADEAHVIETPFGRRLFTRKQGEALHPEREPLAVYENMRQTIGEYNFLSQYQQTPTPVGGAMVKTHWLKFYYPGEQPAQFARILQSWDTANKATELSDFSVCTTWGTLYKKYYLLHVFRRRMNYPELKRAVVAQAVDYRAGTVLIEDKASGTQLIQELQNEGLLGVTAYKPPPGSDKIMRLHAQTAMFENGFVLLPIEAAWLNEYIKELTSFPGTKYDDQVDSTTQLLHYLAESHDIEIWMRLARIIRRMQADVA